MSETTMSLPAADRAGGRRISAVRRWIAIRLESVSAGGGRFHRPDALVVGFPVEPPADRAGGSPPGGLSLRLPAGGAGLAAGRIPGGCNNGSPYQAELDGYGVVALPARLDVLLWHDAPRDVAQPAEMRFTIWIR